MDTLFYTGITQSLLIHDVLGPGRPERSYYYLSPKPNPGTLAHFSTEVNRHHWERQNDLLCEWWHNISRKKRKKAGEKRYGLSRECVTFWGYIFFWHHLFPCLQMFILPSEGHWWLQCCSQTAGSQSQPCQRSTSTETLFAVRQHRTGSVEPEETSLTNISPKGKEMMRGKWYDSSWINFPGRQSLLETPTHISLYK